MIFRKVKLGKLTLKKRIIFFQMCQYLKIKKKIIENRYLRCI